MKKTLFLLCAVILGASCNSAPATQPLPAQVTISKERLLDKIKGGWAGQTIGCTYGGPTEFKFNGTMIQEYTPIPWPEHYIKWWYENTPGLYDDVYMDLTFVEVFDRLGIDAPVDSLAAAFANAGYVLWHANQAARYNILNGIRPPESGHWLNNPHADDLDFQIEADFAGLMSPGMPNAASEFCDRAGHIMNYGDGWYGGVYVAAMYSLSFVSDDIGFIVEEALKTIPEQSRYHRCMKDVIAWHKQYPGDWKRTWFECEKKWSSDIGCPDGGIRAVQHRRRDQQRLHPHRPALRRGRFLEDARHRHPLRTGLGLQPGIGRRYPGRNARVQQNPRKMDAQPARSGRYGVRLYRHLAQPHLQDELRPGIGSNPPQRRFRR